MTDPECIVCFGRLDPAATAGFKTPQDTHPFCLQCNCPTPFDGKRTGTGYHCPECHSNFASFEAAKLHRPRFGLPAAARVRCVEPWLAVSWETRRPFYRETRVGRLSVWMLDPEAVKRRVGV
jgi:hypothetical protein